MTLIDDIREIVHNDSGGLKFTDLQMRLITEKGFRGHYEDLEKTIRESEDVGIFEYSWHMNPSDEHSMARYKMFVYQKE